MRKQHKIPQYGYVFLKNLIILPSSFLLLALVVLVLFALVVLVLFALVDLLFLFLLCLYVTAIFIQKNTKKANILDILANVSIGLFLLFPPMLIKTNYPN